jgi:hypothetical protein
MRPGRCSSHKKIKNVIKNDQRKLKTNQLGLGSRTIETSISESSFSLEQHTVLSTSPVHLELPNYGMRKRNLASVLSFGFMTVFCLSAFASTQSGPVLREQGGLTAVARVEGTQLKLRVLDGTALYSGIVHAYLVRKDLAFFYFEYPTEADKGQYSLDLPAMEMGTYDLILEITGGNGHQHDSPRFVQVFQMGIPGGAADGKLDGVRKLELQGSTPSIKAAGQVSTFDLTTLLNGKPVAWNPYYVHQFILKTDWSYFKHDHPGDVRELGVGSVRSNFKFPGAGEYAVYQFIESGVQVSGERLRPVLRFPGVLNVP